MIYFFLLLCLFAVVGMAFARRALARSGPRSEIDPEYDQALAARAKR